MFLFADEAKLLILLVNEFKCLCCTWAKLDSLNGGEGGSRTHGRIAPSPVFKTGAIDHSATSPCLSCISLFTNEWSTLQALPERSGAVNQ